MKKIQIVINIQDGAGRSKVQSEWVEMEEEMELSKAIKCASTSLIAAVGADGLIKRKQD